jgi:hypothetical protein
VCVAAELWLKACSERVVDIAETNSAASTTAAGTFITTSKRL